MSPPPRSSIGCATSADISGTSVGVSIRSLVPETACSRSVERRKPGPPSKGPRVQLKARLPEELYDAAVAEAARRGMTLNDLVGETLAQMTGVNYYLHQEALKTA